MSYDDLGGALTGVTEQDVSSALSSMSDRNEPDDGPPMGQTFEGGVISRQQVPQFDRSSATYQKFLSQTGRSNTNPYGNRGIFSQLFGMKNVDYTSQLGSAQIQRLNDMAYQRYISPNQPVSGKFGSIFGGATGEETIAGPRRAIQQDRGIAGVLGGLTAGAIAPGGGFLAQAAQTDYTAGALPEGYREVDRSGIMGQAMAALEGITGATPIETVGETAASLVDRARQGIASFMPQQEQQIIQDQMLPPSPRPTEIDAMSQQMMPPSPRPTLPAVY